MSVNAARVGEWIVVLSAMIGGGLWLGTLNTRVEAGETQLKDVADTVKATPTQVAVLQTQMSGVERSIEELKQAQQKQAEEARALQQQILQEVRRR